MKPVPTIEGFTIGETWSYPGNLTREEATAILGFDPGVPDGKITTVGYVTNVDRKNGIITVSAKPPTPRSKRYVFPLASRRR